MMSRAMPSAIRSKPHHANRAAMQAAAGPVPSTSLLDLPLRLRAVRATAMPPAIIRGHWTSPTASIHHADLDQPHRPPVVQCLIARVDKAPYHLRTWISECGQ